MNVTFLLAAVYHFISLQFGISSLHLQDLSPFILLRYLLTLLSPWCSVTRKIRSQNLFRINCEFFSRTSFFSFFLFFLLFLSVFSCFQFFPSFFFFFYLLLFLIYNLIESNWRGTK